MRNTRKGFTLVELLIVIAVLGALATMMSMAAKDATPKAKAAKILSDYKTIASAVNIYLLDSADAKIAPNVKYFNNHSDDYLAGGKFNDYSVTSDDKKWYVAYQGTDKEAATVMEAMQPDSTDIKMEGWKLRIK